jgi:hypothetical protein
MRVVPLLPIIVHGVNYTRMYWHKVFVGIFQWRWEMFPFSLTLFIVSITNYERLISIKKIWTTHCGIWRTLPSGNEDEITHGWSMCSSLLAPRSRQWSTSSFSAVYVLDLLYLNVDHTWTVYMILFIGLTIPAMTSLLLHLLQRRLFFRFIVFERTNV